MCQAVNDAIIELIECGTLTTTNVLVNMDTLSNAAILRQKYPWISVGMHWNVTTGHPVTEAGLIHTLVDNTGSFYPVSEFKRRMNHGLIDKKHFKLELANQYELFRKYCGAADYWNTHENSVLNLRTYKVYAEAARLLGIKATRNFQRVYIDYDIISGKRKLREILVRNIMNVWFGMLNKKDFIMPEGRVITFSAASKVDLKKLYIGLIKTDKTSVEIVIHPSVSAEHPYFGLIAKERVSEYQFFKSKGLLKLFKGHYFTLANYGNLNG